MRKVLICVHPKWCELIFNGQKTIEVRKTRPLIDMPFKVFVYETKAQFVKSIRGACTTFGYGRGKVIGSFVCDRVDEFDSEWSEYAYACAPTDIPCAMPMSEENAIKICKEKGCMTLEDIIDYFGDEEWRAYFWHISDLKIYDKPRELGEFRKVCLNGKCSDCIYEECKITRPPQSWCYVDELQ